MKTITNEQSDWYVTIADDCQVIKSWIIRELPYHKAFKEAREQMETHYEQNLGGCGARDLDGGASRSIFMHQGG